MNSVLEHFKYLSPPVTEYRIRPGDTLSELAQMFRTSVREIVRLNPNIRDVNKIRAGETIDIPTAQEMTTARPDSGDIDYTGMQSQGYPGIPTAEEDAIEPNGIMESIAPLLKPLGALGAMGATKGMAGLARAAPAAPPAVGQIGNNMVRGAVPWAGAKPALNNVRPITGSTGAAAAMMAPKPPANQALMRAIQQKLGTMGNPNQALIQDIIAASKR